MLDLSLQNYIGWHVKPVMKIKNAYGFRVILKYMDGSKRTQQKAGFATKREAEKARERTVAELYNGTYIVYANLLVSEYMEHWLEQDIRVRARSEETVYTYSRIVKNHIIPILGKKRMADVRAGDVQKLYNMKVDYSVSVAKLVKTVMNISFRYAVNHKVIAVNPAEGIRLPKKVAKKPYHARNIDLQKTLTLEQIMVLLEASKNTPIHMQILFNVLMGLRRSEINGLKYSDVDFVNRTLTVQRQLGKKLNGRKEDFLPKTFTKQEISLKTESSYRALPIPDYVFEAILQEKEQYEKNKSRRKTSFQDLGYICCSSYGRPRSKGFHWKHYKKLLEENGLPDIRWHDLRSTFCTLLLKNDFNPKAVSRLLGHAHEILTIDVYGDNPGIISDCIPEIADFIDEVVPDEKTDDKYKEELLDIVADAEKYLEPISLENEEAESKR